jgi:uncharacterized SAM-binding protein YcdF (DUF218 family)
MVLKINSPYSKRRNQPTYSCQKKTKRQGKKLWWGLGFFGLTLSTWLGFHVLRGYFLRPDAILVLGGHEEREVFAAKFAQTHPNLPIWVSGGSPQDYAEEIFAKQGIESDRLKLDYHAVDTLTNFTTLIDEMKATGVENVYLITSENHIRRAEIIGLIVFGSQGIAIKPISVPSNGDEESVLKCLRDGIRSLIWVLTGETITYLKQ